MDRDSDLSIPELKWRKGTTNKRRITHHEIDFTIDYAITDKRIPMNKLKRNLRRAGSEFRWESFEKVRNTLPLPTATSTQTDV